MAKTLILFLLLILPTQGWSYLFLKDRMGQATPGDYIVTAQNKTLTLWAIRERDDRQVIVEEISVPAQLLELGEGGWKEWVKEGAPEHTIWLAYSIDLRSGRLLGLYSFTNKRWCEVDKAGNFLTTLMNLGFTQMPVNQRRRANNRLGYWNPPVIFEGNEIPDVHLDHFEARWPRDSSELSDKYVDIYLPPIGSGYPAYFPYWLQVIGALAQAKLRIVDSGSNLKSPVKILWPKQQQTLSTAPPEQVPN